MGQFTDRSRILTYQRCPRARYYEYEIYGHGVRRASQSIPLVTGGMIHEGLACLLLNNPIEFAVAHALNLYDEALVAHGFELHEGETPGPVVAEQRALIEAILRGANIVVIPGLLDKFDVVSVEEELTFKLGSLTFQSRPDAVLRDRETRDLYVLSWKTAGISPSEREFRKFEEEGRHDDQGISEVIAVEQKYKERVMGVRMEYLLKGPRKEYPADSGQWVQWSPLIRGYVRLGITESENEWAANWNYTGTDGRGHTLGKGWQRVNVYNCDATHAIQGMSVKSWIDWLAANDRATLDKQFKTPMPFFRNSSEVESWIRQRTTTEADVTVKANFTERLREEGRRDDYITALDTQFPQHRRSCDWPGKCQFQEICFGSVDPADPLADSSFVARKPHHLPELVHLNSVSHSLDKIDDILKEGSNEISHTD